ncbi:Lrp/AsnC family transcriptional regulator [Kribbella solani]|uniref:Lrp/AsnC family transcriptional regulator n=1 Tax=Kribbella solani TaxID=236067 RepID=UPI0029A357A6|nr:Lrp/AsnC family transcriptional regulator [Kribbella solani]MDX2969868.1 Lrp/AsnC family transcriptional regulator [Kribbella solani]MDX2969904.1 Lrp/AsnC family transcriptional regulator [Kribbella solani]MDX3004040.1 Lrp/AsnC family transcriptional regulator [Kribbella solani]
MPKDRRTPGPAPRATPGATSGTGTAGLDEVDRQLVALLSADGRMPNNALAEATGIAPSTCLTRVRSLRERGVIRGFHAEVDLAALGRPLQALIAIRIGAHSRDEIDRFRAKVPRLPGVLSLFHVSGANDYLLHVSAATPDALREFVLDHLTADPAVSHAETSLIFEHVRATPDV